MIRRINVPNRITLARLLLSIIFFFVLVQYSQRDPTRRVWMLDTAWVLFIIAACTDFLDGYLARKHGWVTPLGRILDPFVDKVLICGAFILFAGHGFVDQQGHNVTKVEAWMVVVIVGRELLVTGIRGFQESLGKAFPASLHGKLKMWVQCIAAPTILFLVAREDQGMSSATADLLKVILVWLTVIVTALSALQYLARSKDIFDASAPA
ncbi:MAG: CDP-diacylglycerol--glycerol-3-phosphate 3-phosphatidyltransferase [Planctomycetota bacterium]